MKLFTFILGLLTLGLSSPALAITDTEAAVILYAYTVYNFDVDVWGRGKGHITPKCKGSTKPDNRCTLNEWINYLESGKASETPTYYEYDPDTANTFFSMLPGDMDVIVRSITRIPALTWEIWGAKRSAVGIFKNFSEIADRNYKHGLAMDIDATRHMRHLKLVLGGLRYYSSSAVQGSFAERMERFHKNVFWEIDESQDAVTKRKQRVVNWQKTVRRNPELRDPTSKMYTNVVLGIIDERIDEGNRRDREVARRVTNLFNSCFAD